MHCNLGKRKGCPRGAPDQTRRDERSDISAPAPVPRHRQRAAASRRPPVQLKLMLQVEQRNAPASSVSSRSACISGCIDCARPLVVCSPPPPVSRVGAAMPCPHHLLVPRWGSTCIGRSISAMSPNSSCSFGGRCSRARPDGLPHP